MRGKNKNPSHLVGAIFRALDLSKLQVIAKNSDWFIALFTLVVTGWSNNYYFGSAFSTVIWKSLYHNCEKPLPVVELTARKQMHTALNTRHLVSSINSLKKDEKKGWKS